MSSRKAEPVTFPLYLEKQRPDTPKSRMILKRAGYFILGGLLGCFTWGFSLLFTQLCRLALQGDPMKFDSPVKVLSNFGDAETWNKGTPFCNIVGSGNDSRGPNNDTYPSWLKAWEEITPNPPSPVWCAVKDCKNNTSNAQMVGGHVVTTGDPVSPAYGANGIAHLIPLCSWHNGQEDGIVYKLRETTPTVILNNYCKADDKDVCDTKTSPLVCDD